MINKNSQTSIIQIFSVLLLFCFIIIYGYNYAPVSSDNGYWYSISERLTKGDISTIYSNLLPPGIPYLSAILKIMTSENLIFLISPLFFILLLFSLYLYSKKSVIIIFIFIFGTSFTCQIPFFSGYYPYIFLLVMSIFLFLKFLKTEKYVFCFLSMFFLVTSIYFFKISFIFFSYPAFFIFEKKKYIGKIVISYIVLFILSVPWLYWNISIGGRYFYASPYNWYIFDALPYVNNVFWGYQKFHNFDFFKKLLIKFYEQFNLSFLIYFSTLFMISFKYLKNKYLLFYAFFLFIFLFIIGVSPFDRYYLHILTVILIFFIKNVDFFDYNSIRKSVILPLLFFLLLTTPIYKNLLINIENKRKIEFIAEKFNKYLDSNNKLLTRNYIFQPYISSPIVTATDLSKEDFIGYLTVQNKEIIFNKYNINWVLLVKPYNKWEESYYKWVEVLYKREDNHLDYLLTQEILYDDKNYTLVKVGKKF